MIISAIKVSVGVRVLKGGYSDIYIYIYVYLYRYIYIYIHICSSLDWNVSDADHKNSDMVGASTRRNGPPATMTRNHACKAGWIEHTLNGMLCSPDILFLLYLKTS